MPELIFEALAGARYTYLRAKVFLEIQGPFQTRTFTAFGDRDWADPFVGGRVTWRFSERWLAALRTDIGGLTVNSDLTFNVNAEAAYKINEWLSVYAGYRALYTDYETGSGREKFAFNVWMHGPWLGLGAEF
jgi:hypothetical protein